LEHIRNELEKNQRKPYVVRTAGVFKNNRRRLLDRAFMRKQVDRDLSKLRLLQTCEDVPTNDEVEKDFGLSALQKHVDTKDVKSCADVPVSYCEAFPNLSVCDHVARACRGTCAAKTGTNWCINLQDAAEGMPWFYTPKNLMMNGDLNSTRCENHWTAAGYKQHQDMTDADWGAYKYTFTEQNTCLANGCTHLSKIDFEVQISVGNGPTATPEERYALSDGTYVHNANIGCHACWEWAWELLNAPGPHNFGCSELEVVCDCLSGAGLCSNDVGFRDWCPQQCLTPEDNKAWSTGENPGSCHNAD